MPINIHKNNRMMLLMANLLLFAAAGRRRSGPATGKPESTKCAAHYGRGMPDENSLDEEAEPCASESLLPYCTTTAKLIMSTMIVPTKAIIERCLLDREVL